jgi:hypothetical protein
MTLRLLIKLGESLPIPDHQFQAGDWDKLTILEPRIGREGKLKISTIDPPKSNEPVYLFIEDMATGKTAEWEVFRFV